MKNKKAQEEIVGFALIIVIVAVILVIFLGIYMRNPEKEEVESYEVNSFIYSTLGYSTDCSTNRQDFLPVEDLIYACTRNEDCKDGENSCAVLENTLRQILDASWKTGENDPYMGYELNISLEGNDVLSLQKGSESNTYRGAWPVLSKGLEIDVIIYARPSNE